MNAQIEETDQDIEIEVQGEDSSIEIENPNIQDQLDNAPNSNEPEQSQPSAEERFDQFMDSDEELKEYGQGVRKRIGTLTYNWREAERQRDEAIRYAQQVREENEGLKNHQYEQDGAYIVESKEKTEAQIDTAKRQLKEALAIDDADLIAEANANIARFSVALSRIEDTEKRYQQWKKQQPVQRQPSRNQQAYGQARPQPQPTYPQQQQRPPEPDERAKSWAEKNKWFGEDQIMTNAALTIHNQLVTEEGYLPETDEYYREIDRRIRKNFPQKFASRSNNDGATATVTPGEVGTTGRRSGKRQVKLTASQVSIAKRLGVPLEEYAKYV